MRRSLLLFTFAVCLSGPLMADGLTEVIAELKALPARERVQLKIDQDSTEREEGKDKHEQRSLLVEDGPDGLRILEDSTQGAKRKAKGGGAARLGKSGEDGAWRQQVRAHLDLLEELEQARLIEDKVETLDGQPLRCLRLELDLSLDDNAKKTIKHASHVATLWLGKDGLPVAMKRDLDLEIRAFVFVHVATRLSSWCRFFHLRDRLISTEVRETVQGKAMGRTFSGSEVTLCSPKS